LLKYLRATIRLLALCGVTAAYYLRWLTGAGALFAFADLRSRWRAWNFRVWARAAARVMGMKINAHNQPPAGAFLLVSNHLSYVDIVVLASQLNCVFIAKSEVAGWPILGMLCRSMNTIFINRKRKRDIVNAMGNIEKAMSHGSGVVLFAEGTSSNGESVLPFRPSLLEFATRRHVPVHYSSINYRVPAGEMATTQSVCWWGDMTFPDHLFRLLQLPKFEANLVYGPRPIVAHDRRLLAAKLWSAVSTQLALAGQR
jgi:1-acyl-sn-glycerol-3-phosphate acyltransferase